MDPIEDELVAAIARTAARLEEVEALPAPAAGREQTRRFVRDTALANYDAAVQNLTVYYAELADPEAFERELARQNAEAAAHFLNA